jgi:type I restriction enzyme S subunit
MESNKARLVELLSSIVDNRGRTCPTASEGVPLIATNCISNDHLYPSYDTVRYVDDTTFRTWFRAHPKPGDLLFVTKGTPGRICLAPNPVDFCIAQDMVALRVDDGKVYPRFLFAALRSQAVQIQIEQLHVGTLIPHFKKGDFDKLWITTPHRAAQEFIGDMYFEFSAKIELNRHMGATLDELLRTQVARASEDKGVVVSLAEIAQYVNGGAFTKDANGLGLPIVRIRELNGGINGETLRSSAVVPEVQTADAGDLLFSWSGSLDAYRWHGPRVLVNQHIFKVLPNPGIPQWLVYCALRIVMPEFQAIARDKATTMGHIQRRHLEEAPVRLPMGQLKVLDSVVGPLYQFGEALAAESETLTSLRETLLPKLISGELPVGAQRKQSRA